MPQKVQFFFFHMHVPASWFGSRQRVQTFESLLSSLLLLLLLPPLLLLFPLPRVFDLALFAEPLLLFSPVFLVAS